MLDGSERRGAGATIVTSNDQMVSLGLGYTCSDGSNAYFRTELHTDACTGISVFEIVDELGHILDRIDIMMRRWTNQTHARGRVT